MGARSRPAADITTEEGEGRAQTPSRTSAILDGKPFLVVDRFEKKEKRAHIATPGAQTNISLLARFHLRRCFRNLLFITPFATEDLGPCPQAGSFQGLLGRALNLGANPNVYANPQVERTQKRGGRERCAPAPLACYEAVVELEEPLAEDPDEEPPVDPVEPLFDGELPVPVEPLVEEPLGELPVSLALLLPEPPVCEPDAPPEPLPEPPVAEPVELPEPLVLPDSVPPVDDPLVLPDPEAELSDDAVPS